MCAESAEDPGDPGTDGAFDLVIVDAGISASQLDTLLAGGAEVLVADPE
ncbi:hypothetical protein AB0I02_08595 [Streptomyces phaeochromogenes]